MTSSKKIKLPPAVVKIYQAIEELQTQYAKHQRKFTLDGHLLGSIGEVVAAEALDLTLHKMSHPGHDAYDANGDVQIKITAGTSVGMYSSCDRLVVLHVISSEEAEIVYDGPGTKVWDSKANVGKNGQKVVSLKLLRQLASLA
jgi:hypothetical protein